jgi:hypothetical protein
MPASDSHWPKYGAHSPQSTEIAWAKGAQTESVRLAIGGMAPAASEAKHGVAFSNAYQGKCRRCGVISNSQ